MTASTSKRTGVYLRPNKNYGRPYYTTSSPVCPGSRLQRQAGSMSRTHPDRKRESCVTMLELLEHKELEWINQSITLWQDHMWLLTERQFFTFLGVLYYSHNAGFALQKVLERLHRLGAVVPRIELCRYLLTHMLAFPPARKLLEEDAIPLLLLLLFYLLLSSTGYASI